MTDEEIRQKLVSISKWCDTGDVGDCLHKQPSLKFWNAVLDTCEDNKTLAKEDVIARMKSCADCEQRDCPAVWLRRTVEALPDVEDLSAVLLSLAFVSRELLDSTVEDCDCKKPSDEFLHGYWEAQYSHGEKSFQDALAYDDLESEAASEIKLCSECGNEDCPTLQLKAIVEELKSRKASA